MNPVPQIAPPAKGAMPATAGFRMLRAASPAVCALALLLMPASAFALFRSDVHEKTLSNGLRIIFVRVKDSPRMECRIFYRHGSSCDPHGREGMSSLVARLTFSGTRKVGSRDFAEESAILSKIDDFEALFAREKIPADFLDRLKAIPLNLRKIEDSIKATLESLSESARGAMSKEEMDKLRAFVESEEKKRAALESELLELKSHPDFLRLETRNSIGREINNLRKLHAALIVPGEIEALYARAGGIGLSCAVERDLVRFGVSLPANMFEHFLWIESDRMRNCVFRDFMETRGVAALASSDSGMSSSDEYARELDLLAFLCHPYGRPPEGWRSGIEAVSRNEALAFYALHYSPDRAVIVFAGDTEPANLLARASDYFEFPPSAGEKPEPSREAGPRQTGTRRLAAAGEGFPRVDLVWRAPAFGHDHSPVMDLAAECLRARSGHLPQSLLDSGLASGFSVDYSPGRITGEIRITAWPVPKASSEAVENAARKAVDNLLRWGFTSEAVSGAAGRIFAGWGACAMSPPDLADALGFAEVMGGWASFFDRQTAVSRVSLDDIKNVMNLYLKPSNLTAGVFAGGEK